MASSDSDNASTGKGSGMGKERTSGDKKKPAKKR